MSKNPKAFTFVEVLLASVAASILIVGACEFYMLTIKQWDVQTSYGAAVTTTDAALERIEDDARYAISFTTKTSGSNTLYVFTLPANSSSGTVTTSQIDALDATGNYIPQRVSGTLEYVAGPQVAFYLSNTTGSTSVSGGTVLWRATAAAGSTTFTPDSSWSLVNSSVGRCQGVQSFSITTNGMPSNAVLVSLSSTSTSGPQSKAYSTSRELYMESVIAASPLGSPADLTATAGTNSIALSWSASSGATSYNVYRGTTPGGENATAYATGITGTTYTDTSVTNGTTYYYFVEAENGSGLSGESNQASATATTVSYVTVTPSVPSLSNYYGDEQLAITNTQPMTSLTVTISVVETTGLSYSSDWNSFWGGYLTQGYTSNGSTLTFKSTLNSGDTQTNGTYDIDAAFNLTGTAHSASGDSYTVQVTAGGVSQTLTGYF